MSDSTCEKCDTPKGLHVPGSKNCKEASRERDLREAEARGEKLGRDKERARCLKVLSNADDYLEAVTDIKSGFEPS